MGAKRLKAPQFIAVKDFEHFQHYTKRTPPWIKFYNALLDDYRFLQLSDAARSQLMLIWLVASRHQNRIPNDVKYIAQAIHCTTKLQLSALIESGWLYHANDVPLAQSKQGASVVLAKRTQSAIPEEEEEEEGEEETESEVEPEVSNRGIDQSEEVSVTPPRVVLPREAEHFLAQFYEPVGGEGSKSRDRYVNVKGQLYEVLDPLHPGPKLRGGQRVKARSTEHLIDCIKAVMRDPPPNRDLAILWLLNKLTDPAKGPTVTEKHKATEQYERQLEERYHVEAKRAGVQWAKENPDEYQPILQQVEANYRGNTNAFAALAKQTELTQKCAKAAGFPPFEEWREQITEAVA